MKLIVGWVLVGSAATWLSSASPVQACECVSQALYSTVPADGAVGVPLNSAMELMGNFKAGSIAFSGPQGAAVEFTLNAGPTPSCPGTSASLVPKQPMLPNTKYVVKVESVGSEPGATSFAFTTGTALLPDEALTAPVGTASVVFDVPSDGFSCGDGEVMACTGVDPWDNVEVLAKRGDETLLRWILKDKDGLFQLRKQPDCLELRRIGATGRRSDPLKLCGEALKARAYRATDRDANQWVQCSNGVVGQPSSTGIHPDGGTVPRVDSGTASADASSSAGPSDDAATPASVDAATPASADAAKPTLLDTSTAAPSTEAGCSASPRRDRDTSVPLFISIALLLATSTRRRRAAR